MDYPIPVEGLPAGQLTVRHGLWTGPRFFLAGRRLKAVKGVVEVPVGGKVVHVRLAGGAWTFLQEPAVLIGDQRLVVGARIPGWLFVVALLPLALLLVGGAIGGVFGGIAVGINIGLARTSLPLPGRVLAMLGVGLAASVAWLVVAIGLSAILERSW